MEHLYDRLMVLENRDRPLSDLERLEAIRGPLLSWYDCHARILPWRENPEPYRVWISEIMLQQTRVEAVKPYFERFIQALPDIKSLAEVEEEKLLKLWQGLGYYNRARNLKKAAILAQSQYQGQLPRDYKKLLTFPGIGSYTAGAIASIAYQIPMPAVDGNVLRVLSRVLGSQKDILKPAVKKEMEQLLMQVIPKDRASQFNQGLIEIGAIVCVPNGKPRCENCPFSSVCLAKKECLTQLIPVKSAKKPRKIQDMTVFLVEKQDKIAIHKREDKGLLASLYEYPNCQGFVNETQAPEALGIRPDQVLSVEPLSDAVHIFTHVEWHMKAYRIKIREDANIPYLMVSGSQLLEQFPIPNAFSTYTKLIK